LEERDAEDSNDAEELARGERHAWADKLSRKNIPRDGFTSAPAPRSQGMGTVH
jgi:hypothetical protein